MSMSMSSYELEAYDAVSDNFYLNKNILKDKKLCSYHSSSKIARDSERKIIIPV